MSGWRMEGARVAFTEKVDLASEKAGGRVLAANDDFFAEKENLLKASEPVFIPDKYTERGKWMDGWESRRKRGPNRLFEPDWCVVRLGMPGEIHGVNVDTAHFVGNYPEYASLEACESSDDDLAGADWTEIVPKTPLSGGTANLMPVASRERWTHLRMNIHPDGGVARLRVHGKPVPDWERALAEGGGEADLAAALNGAEVVACEDMFFGPKDNLILPGRAAHMGEGWETRRRRGPGNDWIIVRLGAPGTISRIEIDTNHFKGNFPESASVEGCFLAEGGETAADFRDRGDIAWMEILPEVRLQAHHQHFYEKEIVDSGEVFTHVRLSIYPDGGVSRLRVYGVPKR